MAGKFRRRAETVVIGLLATGVGAVLAWIVGTQQHSPGLRDTVFGALDRAGADNPVTAVLLNFRGYDTLLEVMVILLAMVTVWSLGSAPRSVRPAPADNVLAVFIREVAPLMIIVAIYLLWAGKELPGGAFQAGAVLGAGAVILVLSGVSFYRHWSERTLRGIATAGAAVFLVAGLLPLIAGDHFLEYPVDQAGTWILIIEAVATVSIGLILVLLFLGGRPDARPTGRRHADADDS